jgi:hypothetical protein
VVQGIGFALSVGPNTGTASEECWLATKAGISSSSTTLALWKKSNSDGGH